MMILTANTKAAAEALNAKAFAYIVTEQGANGTRWSEVLTNGAIYGITYDGSIEQAFTVSELAGLVEGERKQTVDGITTGDWEVA